MTPSMDPTAGGSTRRARHVALVLPTLGPGGAERVASSLASCWIEAGHEVGLITISSPESDAYPLGPAVRRIALDRLKVSRNPVEGLLRASGRVLALRRALGELHPDVVISFLQHTNVMTLLAMAGRRVPVFVCERSDPRQNLMGRQWAPLRRALYPWAAGVVVQTEAVAAWARAFCPRVHVIPNFVARPSRTANPGAEEGPKTLVTLGRLERVKGFDLLIEAFARVCGRHGDWSLRILGEGPERPRLEALLASLHLEDRVSLPGRVPDPERHLSAAHAFALSSRYEGFPNALLEAMASGLPIVAFDCPSGPAEIVVHERNGLLVKPEDVAELAAALDRLMTSAAERRRLGQSAREIAVRLSPGAVLEKWSALLSGESR